MNIRQLKYFISAAEHLNFTVAARSLYIAQSTLSQQIMDLEKQFGVKLFSRNSHDVKLTVAGTALVKEARDLITKSDEVIRIVRQAEFGVAGSIVIGFVAGLERRILPNLVASLRHKYPNITLKFQNLDIQSLDRMLRHNDVDIGVTVVPHLNKISGLIYKTIYTDILSIVISYDHSLAHKANIDFSDLNQESFIFTDLGSRGLEHLLQVCSRRGIFPKITPILGIEAALLSIGAGAGVSILPHTVSAAYSGPNVRYIDLDSDDCLVDVVAAWKNCNDNPCIPIILDELEAKLNSVSQPINE